MALNYNEPITFGRGGSAMNLNCEGIDFSDSGGRSWTRAPLAEMDIQLPFARQDVAIEVEASPFLIADRVTCQQVFIFLGGLHVGFHTFKGHAVRTFPVNRSAVSGRAARLSLAIPTAISPKSLNIGEDLRELGIYLASITFKTVP